MFVLVDDGERVACLGLVAADRPSLGSYLPRQLSMEDLIAKIMEADGFQLAFFEADVEPF